MTHHHIIVSKWTHEFPWTPIHANGVRAKWRQASAVTTNVLQTLALARNGPFRAPLESYRK